MKKIIASSADPDGGRADLSRFEGSFAEAMGRRFTWNTEQSAILLHIFGNSPALSHHLIANPNWADEICRSGHLKKRKPAKLISSELNAAIKNVDASDSDTFGRLLRHFKYREMIRLVARDLAGNIDVHEMLAEWSDVASAVIDAAYSHTFESLSRRLGAPTCSVCHCEEQGDDAIPVAARDRHARLQRTRDDKPKEDNLCTGVIIALGKLGGHELNMSSDVDILSLYASDDGLARSNNGKETSNHEFFVKLTVEFTKLLSAFTPDGFLFRVDHELRPEGNQGALANSFDAAERYYQYFGHDWERQALIRARPVAGNIRLGEDFIGAIMPFIYRRSVSLSDLSHMRSMKLRVEKESSSCQGTFNVKLGAGGIREAEFFTQALQQFHGGGHPRLRCTNTFDAIDRLTDESMIHTHAAKQLRSAYAFLRKTENMIQIENELQKHSLPKSDSDMTALAARMGISSGNEFLTELQKHTMRVQRLFDALFEADYEFQELEEAILGNLETCSGDEEKTDSLAWFRQQESRRVQHLDLNKRIPLFTVLRRLSLIADVVIRCAWKMATDTLAKKFGQPQFEDASPGGFAVIGMGKLGSREMDYGSDLDICFIYSGAGRTDGNRSISNIEYFTKLAQRIISTISLPTRYGRAYAVDSELRPSGGQGALVTTLESFVEYHTNTAQVWERLSILRARVIAGDEEFAKEVKAALSSLAYECPPPAATEIRREIEKLRNKTLAERAKEDDGTINLKTGDGGVGDLESLIQYYHLLNVGKFNSLRTQNTFEIVTALKNEGAIDEKMSEDLIKLLSFYRSLISYLRLITGRQAEKIRNGADYLEHLADLMEYASTADLMEAIREKRERTKEMYKTLFQVKS